LLRCAIEVVSWSISRRAGIKAETVRDAFQGFTRSKEHALK